MAGARGSAVAAREWIISQGPASQPGAPLSAVILRRRIALISGAIDAAANVCYVLATRAGLFGLAVVITALYPGMTVLLARFVLGERMRWLQRAGLLLAAVGVVLVAA